MNPKQQRQQQQTYTRNPGYAAVRIWINGEASWMAAQGRTIVFDTPRQAKMFLPQLGEGRVTRWTPDGETCYWLELWPGKVSKAQVITGYDVYNLPPGLRSEARSMAWRWHVAAAEWWHTPDPTRRGELIEQQRWIEAAAERN